MKERDCEENITVNETGCWTPDQVFTRRDCLKANSLAARGGSDGLSNSMSPESSLSDKSVSFYIFDVINIQNNFIWHNFRVLYEVAQWTKYQAFMQYVRDSDRA